MKFPSLSKVITTGSPGWQVTTFPDSVTTMPGCAHPMRELSLSGILAQLSIQSYEFSSLPTRMT